MGKVEYRKAKRVSSDKMDNLYDWLDSIPSHKMIYVLSAVAHEYALSKCGDNMPDVEKLDVLKIIAELSSVC